MSQEVPPDVDFKIPSWASKPPLGAHLDVTKGDKLLQKLMIDEKRCYFFGRNPKMCDFAVEHASCSRVHAALLYHKHLDRFFLVDLGSAHGTFIGSIRLEGHKPEQVSLDQSFHFGASTRKYLIREKLRTTSTNGDEFGVGEKNSAGLLGLPEKEDELENLTEYNTALNRRIASMSVPDEIMPHFGRRRQNNSVNFKTEEEVINPEDVDPSVGRFRNMVQTAVVAAAKRAKLEEDYQPHTEIASRTLPTMIAPHVTTSHLSNFGPVSTKLGLSLPNIAPEVELYPPTLTPPVATRPTPQTVGSKRPVGVAAPMDEGPKKKIYAKEAWPGKKPGQHLLI